MMPKRILGLILGIVILLIGSSRAVPARSELQLEMVTSPPVAEIVPDETLVQTQVRLVDGTGQPVRGAWVRLKVDTPPHPRLFNTDFPWVEGTTLVEIESWVEDGTLTWDMVYPIRGKYTFTAEVTYPDGRQARATRTLTVHENPAEVRNFVVLIGLLLTLGLVAGYWIGRGHRPALAGSTVGGLLLVFLLITGPVALAHGSGPTNTTQAQDVIHLQATSPEAHLDVEVSPGWGRVGMLNTVRVRVLDAAGQPQAATVQVVAWHLEDDHPVYTFRVNAPEGEATVRLQFFDGAPHELRVQATPAQGGPLDVRAPIEVEGLAPPTWLKLRVLALLLVPLVLGLAVGIQLGRRPVRSVLQPTTP